MIALEGAAHGVTSNRVNPAHVRTPLVEGQVAELVGYLCSPPASMVTGASFALDGGWTAH